MRITGAARELLREMPVHVLQQGMNVPDPNNPQGQVAVTGLGMLIRTLERRYGSSEEEIVIHTISELMRFHRNHNESTDSLLARWEIALFRANNIGGVDFGPQLRTWLLLNHLNVPVAQWSTYLQHTRPIACKCE